ncbi:MAG: hypothetical protein AB7P14_03880 [Blastocatellales bacterium]
MALIDGISLRRLFTILSFACPLVGAILSWVIINNHEQFWAEVTGDIEDDSNRGSSALMAVSEILQILVILAFGFFMGLVFAVLSLVYKRTLLGFLGLALNLSPCIWIVLVKN